MSGILITNGGTHSADAWANHVLEDLVPMLPGISAEQIGMVVTAREKLRPTVVAALEEIRLHEQQAMERLTKGEMQQLGELIDYHQHGASHPGCEEDVMTMHMWTKKVRSSTDWIDRHVRAIAGVALGCPGEKVGHNEMTDKIFNALFRHVNSIQFAERSHAATSRRLVH